ncbi:hypothetical protein EJ04DRAFT_499147 [Polyplosphaeria fusca]|uniref:Uncharacterized protein n=1 Tax=Polyplosphaeria fusca TaxID=682080 RepID=A0A9P4QT68_9PLEO|nr:hypothetical protein EJ04DRAFT_499147 [Polyplosphaeria fusca]
MAATTALPAPMPTPRSPTLSDFGMILPEADAARSISPGPYVERPPSPSSLLYTHSNRSAHTIRLASPPQGRHPSPRLKSPQLSARSSHSTLRKMGSFDRASRRSSPPNDNLASSPTINENLTGSPAHAWRRQDERRASNTSSSVHSDDIEALKWPGFDSYGGFDDSGVVLEEAEDEEAHDQFPVVSNHDNGHDQDQDRWFDGQSDVDDDSYTSAALSRRAEIILANAKKRLNVMEGNLRGARQSLVVSPTFNTMKMASELQHQLAAARERDRKMYAGIGPIPPRVRAYHSSPLAPASPGHSRVLSETTFSPTNFSRAIPNKRASSALGMGSGPWSPDGYGQGRFPIRESRSVEVMREPRSNGWSGEDRDLSLRSHSRGSRSPNALETLPEYEDDLDQQRSPSASIDLRSQMNDLKGRISSLKMRAQEDSLRRRSLQSLRTPSPFTSAETWYGGADAYKSGTTPVSADAGVGSKVESLVRKSLYGDRESDPSTPRLSPANASPQQHAPEHVESPGKHQRVGSNEEYPTSNYEDAAESQLDEAGEDIRARKRDETDDDFVSGQDEDADRAESSVYEDAVYEMPVAERHEDRVDAFDYENFFLHSAMGTYSAESRRSSASSADSVATTRPATAIHERQASTQSAKRISYHQRNSSVDSVSTVASFATAAEEQDDDEEANEKMDQFSQALLPPHNSMVAPGLTTNGISARPDSAINMRSKPSRSPSQTSRGSSPGSPGALASGLQTSKIFSILTEAHQAEPRLALSEEEKQLIYGLSSSFQQVTWMLQSTSGDQYERKEWRRRLDQARRILNGEVSEGQPF